MTLHPPTLTTARLLLRPFEISDASSVQELAGDPLIYQMTLNIPHPYLDGKAEKWIATHASIFYEKKGVVLAITRADDQTLIGAIGMNATPEHNRAEMGYWIGVPYWGNGYCSEAAIALIDYGFETLDYHKISAHHIVSNPASGRVMEKAGMKFEGECAGHVRKDGEYHSVRLYGLLRD